MQNTIYFITKASKQHILKYLRTQVKHFQNMDMNVQGDMVIFWISWKIFSILLTQTRNRVAIAEN